MMLVLPMLSQEEVRDVRTLLDAAPWGDGRTSAGGQAVQVKNNEQPDLASEPARAAQAIILRALNRSPQFLAAALPHKIFPPHFNRYRGETNHYGRHVDGSVRFTEDGTRIRTDLSCTVFLSEPEEYEGGELTVYDAGGARPVKLAAGQAVLYPGTHVHEVRPVTAGQRIGCFLWIQSMVRSGEQRRLLHEFDNALMTLRADGDNDATVALAGTYHNLLRMWADT